MKTFNYTFTEKEEDFEATVLRVNCNGVTMGGLWGLVTTLVGKGLEIESITPFVFTVEARIKGDKKDTQAICKELEKEGFVRRQESEDEVPF